MRRTAGRLGLAGLVVLTLSAPAYAAWSPGSSNASGAAKAATAPAGPTPALVKHLGRDVVVSWPLVTGSGPAPTYDLLRDGSAVPGCTGLGSAVTTCREDGVTAGPHSYSVVPVQSLWRGAAGATLPVTVPSPSLAITQPASLVVAPTSLTGSIDAFLDGSALSYRLDSATSGQVLPGTPTTFPRALSTASSGATAVSLPIGCGPTSSSTHTVFASNGAEETSATFSFDFSQVLCPSSITSTGGNRIAGAGDTIGITFSRNVQGSSICSDLSNAASSTGAYNNLVVTISDASPSDLLTVSAPAPGGLLGTAGACGSHAGVVLGLGAEDGTINLGTLALGSPSYVTGTALTFQGSGTSRSSLSFNGTTGLTITLGTLQTGTPTAAAANAFATYTPVTAIQSNPAGKSAQGFITSGAPLL